MDPRMPEKASCAVSGTGVLDSDAPDHSVGSISDLNDMWKDWQCQLDFDGKILVGNCGVWEFCNMIGDRSERPEGPGSVTAAKKSSTRTSISAI